MGVKFLSNLRYTFQVPIPMQSPFVYLSTVASKNMGTFLPNN